MMARAGRPKGSLNAKTILARQVEKKRRLCLRCDHPFLSRGPGNRLCGDCNKVNATEYMPPRGKIIGQTYPDITHKLEP